MTFRYGQYRSLKDNHFSGTYTVEDEHKTNGDESYHYYMVTFDADEFMVDGEIQDEETNLSQLEMGITKTDEGQQAIFYFVSSSNMYYCYDY